MSHYPHPLTGRQDAVRTDKVWRGRIEKLESQLGYIICGANNSKTGEPCTKQPDEGEHRCKQHSVNMMKGPAIKEKKGGHHNLTYPPHVGYGMNLMQFIICRRCTTREGCPHYTSGREDECKIEKDIYDNTMALKDKYTIDGDYIQTSLLDTIAFSLIHKFRAERAVAYEGMTYDEVVGAYSSGQGMVELIKNKKAHPLLKHIIDINKQLALFAKSMVATPETIKRFENDKEAVDASNVLSDILKQAHLKRMEDDK